MRLPAPAWLPQRFLRRHQEWPRTSLYPSATSRRYGRQPPVCGWTLSKLHVAKMIGEKKKKQKHMVCLLQAELNTDGYLSAVIWVSEWAKLGVWVISVLWHRYVKMETKWISLCLCCSLLSCLGLTVRLGSNCDKPSCVFVSTVYNMESVWGSARSRSFISLVFVLNFLLPDQFFKPHSHP